ncbi:uncharacterized protein LOC110041562 [Orbicella faveolata]|uniref:uncharacterized protein LOC110041562 n=1 Tax=Orbicella faveolata TaxID=48498 RepID=UPI0009E5D0C1|nr:uncharacterized protein LOC110041562 [Orbicella faveolata]
MIQCFAPDCKHQSESLTCKFFSFPNKGKDKEEYRHWFRLLRRADREPSQHSKVCSCLFRDGLKSAGPEIFERNAHKLFPTQENPTRKKRKLDSKLAASAFCDLATTTQGENLTEQMRNESISTEQVILEAELELTK